MSFSFLSVVQVWNATDPCSLRFCTNMTKEFSWRYTQFSQFNKSDTLLLVSGVHHGNMTTSGEIAVFDLEGKNSTVSCFRTEVLTTVLQKGLFEVTFFVASFPLPRLSIIKQTTSSIVKYHTTILAWRSNML